MIKRLLHSKLFFIASCVLLLLFLVGLYAPFFASSRPLFVSYEGKWFFPLFRSLLFKGFYTKEIDLFFNALLLTSPLFIASLFVVRKKQFFLPLFICSTLLLFGLYSAGSLNLIKNPAHNLALTYAKEKAFFAQKKSDPILGEVTLPCSFGSELTYLSDYEKINRLLLYRRNISQESRLRKYLTTYQKATHKVPPTLFSLDKVRRDEEKGRYQKEIKEREELYEKAVQEFPSLLARYKLTLSEIIVSKIELSEREAFSKSADKTDFFSLESKGQQDRSELIAAFQLIQKQKETIELLRYLEEREKWLDDESKKLFVIDPLFRPFHWEEDAGGGELFNRYLPLTDVTRPNRKDLIASLLFGIRISLVVGLGATLLALIIGLPFGLISGYFGGTTDLMLFRFIEIWEAMPSFFMLLLITAVIQSKSIFLVIFLLGLFGWTHFARFIRAETLKQRSLTYVMASKSLGFSHHHLIFSEILPNAIAPVLALLPFSMMAAMTAEAALAFLGLGEENSTSFGVLMSEARTFFPGESYLLWPPALILTSLLVAFALIGDTLRDALDPKQA